MLGHKKMFEAINKIFPGATLSEKIKNELEDFFLLSKFRLEIFAMLSYSALLLIVIGIAVSVGFFAYSALSIFSSLGLLGGYFFLTDLFKRKSLIAPDVLFWTDCFFYSALMLLVSHVTGGYDSPIRFLLMFLTAVSAPLYGTTKQAMMYLSVLVLLNFLWSLAYSGVEIKTLFSLLEGASLVAAGYIIKNSVNLHAQRSADLQVANLKISSLLQSLEQQNEELAERINEKTASLEKYLSEAMAGKEDLERQRKAILNILEDVDESQNELKKSKMVLEEQRNNLHRIASFNSDLSGVNQYGDIFFLMNKHSNTGNEVVASCFLYVDRINGLAPEFKVFINSPMPKAELSKTRERLLDYLRNSALSGNIKSYLDIPMIYQSNNQNMLTDTAEAGKLTTTKIYPIASASGEFGAFLFICAEEAIGQAEKFIEVMLPTVTVAFSGLEALHKSQRSGTESLVHSLDNGIAMFNAQGRLILLNPSARKYLDLPQAAEEDAFFTSFKPEYGLPEMVRQAIESNAGSSLREAVIGKYTLECFISPVIDSTGKSLGAVVVLHDITMRKVVDQMKTDFVSVASHQLRTPLTAIKLFTEMLIKGDVGELQPTQKEYLDNVYQSTERMTLLVNDLLNVTRIESGRLMVSPRPTDLQELLVGIVNEVKPMAVSKGGELSVKYPKDKMPMIPLDQNLIRQVFHNLLVNAIRYSSATDPCIKLTILPPKEGYVTVSVSDNGLGIPETAKDRIFEKFFRADNAVKAVTEGTGLGLYVSKLIVESSRGKIWFETKENEGTTFFVKIPVSGMEEKKGERGLAIS